MQNQINVLVIFANPSGTDPLNLGRENRIIREAIQLSRNRDNISLEICHAATIHDLRRALLDKDYHIVHISGHGSGAGLILEDEKGGKFVVPQSALAAQFGAYAKPVGQLECVILNACYSLRQGNLISQNTPFTVAMEGTIGDAAAIEFSRGFYDALGAQKGIEFAYQEGCRNVALAASESKFISKILKNGEISQPEDLSPDYISSSQTRGAFEEKPDKTLIGIAVDVSGSMKTGINNNSNRQLTRMQSFGDSLNRLAKNAGETIRKNKSQKIDATIDVFAYAFGLRSGNVCDLLSLLKVGREVISQAEIEELKNRYTNEMKSRYSSYSGLGSLARQFGLGQIASDAENIARQSAEAEIRNKIMLVVKDRLDKSLSATGDTTLNIIELAELSESNGETLGNADEFIFGSTPMVEAFSKIQQRFIRELSKRPKDTLPVLFVLSDGDPTDGNPFPIAEEIKKLGVTIITCFVTDSDISDPKVLLGKKEEHWNSATKLMFDMASIIEGKNVFVDFLLNKGWKIAKDARLFVQVNHSSVMEEFINVVLSPLGNQSDSLPEGR